jgi:hypothetical protein
MTPRHQSQIAEIEPSGAKASEASSVSLYVGRLGVLLDLIAAGLDRASEARLSGDAATHARLSARAAEQLSLLATVAASLAERVRAC